MIVPAEIKELKDKQIESLRAFVGKEGYAYIRTFASKFLDKIQKQQQQYIPTGDGVKDAYLVGRRAGLAETMRIFYSLDEILDAELNARKLTLEK